MCGTNTSLDTSGTPTYIIAKLTLIAFYVPYNREEARHCHKPNIVGKLYLYYQIQKRQQHSSVFDSQQFQLKDFMKEVSSQYKLLQ